jgi:hypothetical protein
MERAGARRPHRRTISLGFFSRRRQINPEGSFAVLG